MRSSRGMALLMAMIISIVIAILAVVGSQMITTAYKDMQHQSHMASQGDNVARAGLVDAIAWFRRQTVQPVAAGFPPVNPTWADGAFNPVYNADPTLSDTQDASIGIVNEYPLSDTTNLWGRYEVKRQTATAISPYDPNAVHDITGQTILDGSAHNGNGFVWYISSKGIIYRKVNAALPYNQSPNQLVGLSRVSTVIRRISLQIPSPQCGFIIMNAGSAGSLKCTVNSYGVLTGGGNSADYAFGYSAITTSSQFPSSSKPPYALVGTGKVTSGTNNPWSQVSPAPTINYVLGVSTSDLKLMADCLVTDTSLLPPNLPTMSLIYVNGNATFGATRTLSGSGILFVNGDLTINTGANCVYSGLVYVTGNIFINDQALISGCVIGCGTAAISSAGASETVEIDYDGGILAMVRSQVCQYREVKSAYQIFSGISDF